MTLDPLAQIHVVTVGAIVVIFLVTFLLLRRTFFLPMLERMESRARRIETARARRAEAEDLLRRARLQAEESLSAARAEAERIADAAGQEGIQVRQAKQAQADAEAETILAQGREEILALRQAEEAQLKDELCACVRQTLTKMIGPVDEAVVRFMVSRALAEKGAG